VLCPRGRLRGDALPSDPRYTFGTLDATEQELRRALAALKKRFGEHVARGSVLIAGFGRGADMAALIARQEPSFFARVALIGRAPAAWSSTVAHHFGSNGGQRVLFVCGAGECRALAESKLLVTRRAGAQAKLGEAAVGPWFDAAMVEAIRRDFPWLVETDPRWTVRGP
jgi:hypothetical protein